MPYVSRLLFHAAPGRTSSVEERLRDLAEMVHAAGGKRPRVLRTHYASAGAPDVVFEQDVDALNDLEQEITAVTAQPAFETWSNEVSALLTQSPKREVLIISSAE